VFLIFPSFPTSYFFPHLLSSPPPFFFHVPCLGLLLVILLAFSRPFLPPAAVMFFPFNPLFFLVTFVSGHAFPNTLWSSPTRDCPVPPFLRTSRTVHRIFLFFLVFSPPFFWHGHGRLFWLFCRLSLLSHNGFHRPPFGVLVFFNRVYLFFFFSFHCLPQHGPFPWYLLFACRSLLVTTVFFFFFSIFPNLFFSLWMSFGARNKVFTSFQFDRYQDAKSPLFVPAGLHLPRFPFQFSQHVSPLLSYFFEARVVSLSFCLSFAFGSFFSKVFTPSYLPFFFSPFFFAALPAFSIFFSFLPLRLVHPFFCALLPPHV